METVFCVMRHLSSMSQNLVLKHKCTCLVRPIVSAILEADGKNHSLILKCAQVAISGWGDTAGFEMGAATDTTRRHFAQNVKEMVNATGADGKTKQRNIQPLKVLILG